MTYKELKNILNSFTDAELDEEVLVYDKTVTWVDEVGIYNDVGRIVSIEKEPAGGVDTFLIYEAP